jgi:hypothetical protein
MTLPSPSASWPDLAGELDCWREAGRVATLWWRDDDAAAASPALDRLLTVADGAPLALAVIPATAEAGLAKWHGEAPRQRRPVGVIQHGWRHANHAGDGRKSEFPAARAPERVAADLAAGRRRLRELFGDAALPVLAPPWNRFDDRFLPLLSRAGIAWLSRLGARGAAAHGIAERNVHVDLVAWKAGRGFIGDAAALALLLAQLRARRSGEVDADEPTGILTHHLVQDAATEAFLRRLLALTRDHPAARWLEAAAVFPAAARAAA